ncbi:hypothetical protein SASPL_124028 [Salvia splendens]|uniref:Uncharacterized protein n=1 Tax=Salvia splendens TaxID=180675 RepID=A0A8X8XLG4_SALSN|nr:uncharacterized protein LOC121743275 [Salvia splendens]KAG6416595.1 hypothetical protein SASPL_124028 [Salvia splendens]
MSRVPINHRILTCDGRESVFSGETTINLSDDTVFQFLSEECEGLSNIFDDYADDEKENQNENENEDPGAEDDNFWETQHQLLQSTICRTSSLESKIRNITKEAVKEACGVCECGRAADGCRKCLMAEICRRLQNSGYNSAICKSKWKSSPEIPSGEHAFLDVIEGSNSKKEVRVIIELNFRGQFEMARANEEYNKMVKKLPEIFVGKMERLMAVLKIVCGAAKRCMKEKKMHLAPWRKHRYMQAKWLRTCERLASEQTFSSGYSGRPARPGRSLLTVDLMMENLQRPVVAVV